MSTARARILAAADERAVLCQRHGGHRRQRPHQGGQIVGDRPRFGVLLEESDQLVDDAVVEVVHHLADLRVGVPGHRAGLQYRIVVRVDGGGTADHPLGERLRRLARLTRREVVGEAVEKLIRVGEDHRQHRVLRVEVEVETRPGDAGPFADGADRQIGERPLVEQLAYRGHDGVALPVAPAATDLGGCGLSGHGSRPSHRDTIRSKLDMRQVCHSG